MSDDGSTDTLTDALGRKLRIKNLNALEQMKLLRAVGPMQSQNQPYFHMVECAAMVVDIDGRPCSMPTNERQIDTAVERLGDEGMAAVMVFRTVNMTKAMADAEKAMEDVGTTPDPLPASA